MDNEQVDAIPLTEREERWLVILSRFPQLLDRLPKDIEQQVDELIKADRLLDAQRLVVTYFDKPKGGAIDA